MVISTLCELGILLTGRHVGVLDVARAACCCGFTSTALDAPQKARVQVEGMTARTHAPEFRPALALQLVAHGRAHAVPLTHVQCPESLLARSGCRFA